MALFLTNDQVKKLITMGECIEELEKAYKEAAEGRTTERAHGKTDTYVPTSKPDRCYMFKSIEGGLHTAGIYAIRLSSDNLAFMTPADGVRRRVKLPLVKGRKYLGFVLLFNTEDGSLLALMQDAYINQLLVGASQGVGTKYLANRGIEEACILGAGWFARGQLEAAVNVRKIKRVRVFSPTREHREEFAKEMSEQLQIEINPAGRAEDAVKSSPLVLCATNAVFPAFLGQWLEPGMTVVSLTGGDPFDKRREVDDETLIRSDVIVASAMDRLSVEGNILYELCEQRKLVDRGKILALKDVIGGKLVARRTEKDKIFFRSSAGLGMCYASAGSYVLKQAEKKGIGTEIDDSLYLEDLRP